MNESTLVPREEMSDLDWMARNVHEWPENNIIETTTTEIPSKLSFDGVAFSLQPSGLISQHVVYATKDQWLARRAELQNKPSWEDAPEWVDWLAQDKSGAWWFFRCHPKAMSEGWDSDSSAYHHSSWVDGKVLGDWRDTLEKRPEQAEFEPFVSVEDAQQELSELEMLAKVSHRISEKRHRITPSKYTKTIHGVSVDVYDVLQAWGVSNPALQHLIKKALQCGQRGHKDNAQDLQDIIDSAIRAKELEC